MKWEGGGGQESKESGIIYTQAQDALKCIPFGQKNYNVYIMHTIFFLNWNIKCTGNKSRTYIQLNIAK